MDANVTWEESRGIGNSYGYNRNEKLEDYKTGKELILILTDVVARGGNLLLDIGPTADGRIPVIMQQRLKEIGDWLKVNGEAIYETTPWKQSYQWSAGKQPEKKGKSFMSGYDINQLIKPDSNRAFIQSFFTKKGKDIFCILPSYSAQLKITNLKMPPAATAAILGNGKALQWKQAGNDVVIDLSKLKPGDIPEQLFVIKLKNAAG
jgi:alpha-L-fucosidase